MHQHIDVLQSLISLRSLSYPMLVDGSDAIELPDAQFSVGVCKWLTNSSAATLSQKTQQVPFGDEAFDKLIPESLISWIKLMKQMTFLNAVGRATRSAAVIDIEMVVCDLECQNNWEIWIENNKSCP